MPLDRDLTRNIPRRNLGGNWSTSGGPGIEQDRSFGSNPFDRSDRFSLGDLPDESLEFDPTPRWINKNLRKAIDFDRGEYIDRRPSGVQSLFNRVFGGADPNEGKTYYPPTSASQRKGIHLDTFPEAKEVAGQYAYPETGVKASDKLGEYIANLFDDPESEYNPIYDLDFTDLSGMREDLNSSYKDYQQEYDFSGMTNEEIAAAYDEFLTDRKERVIQGGQQLIKDYMVPGEFDYPSVGSVFDTRNYPQLPFTQIPGYELGQGLGMDELMYEGIQGKYLDELDEREIWD